MLSSVMQVQGVPAASALPVTPFLKGEKCSKHDSTIMSMQLQRTSISQLQLRVSPAVLCTLTACLRNRCAQRLCWPSTFTYLCGHNN